MDEKAILISVDFDAEEVIWTWFEGKRALQEARKAKVALEKAQDFPTHRHTVVGNELAVAVERVFRLEEFCGTERDVTQHARAEVERLRK